MTAIYEKLVCFDCKKYLSAFPIKVYPNRQVKCWRCSSDDDEGTVSKLYEMIAKELRFPCINRYEGCKMLLEPGEVIAHENICLGTLIKCPVCCNFEGHSLATIEHFKRKHPDHFLNIPEFLISFNDYENKEKFYLYAADLEYLCGIICVRYDDIVNMVHLDFMPLRVSVIDDMSLTKKFEFYSINNKLMYKSSEKICARYVGYSGSNFNNRFNICINEPYPNDIAICKFFIKEGEKICFKSGLPVQTDNTYSSIPLSKEKLKIIIKEVIEEVSKPCYLRHCSAEPVKIIEPCELKHLTDIMSLNKTNNGTQKITYYFDKIRSLQGEMHSPIFYIANTSWKMLIQKTYEGNTPYLSFYLEKEENNDQNKFSYTVNMEIELLSYLSENHRKMSYEKCVFGKRLNERMNWGWKKFISWSILLDPNKKYLAIDEDSIQIALKITLVKILSHEKLCNCSECR